MSNGVIHVGAHKGEEVPQYVADDRKPIICFEPQWKLFVEELKPFLQDGWLELVGCALGNFNGTLDLRVPHHLHQTTERDTMSASGLELIPENAIANGWKPTQCDIKRVNIRRFEDWAKDAEFSRGSCSLLVIDVQGMEGSVLEGFGDYLKDFMEMKIECSHPPLYKGGPDASLVIAYLALYGFVPTTPILRHGDIHFTKDK